MHLIYFDESGNTGNNLADDSQPIFLLCALAVPADRWQVIENDLTEARQAIYPDPIPDDFEMHGAEIISPGKECFFRGKPLGDRIALYQSWIDIAKNHALRVFSRAIVKKRYARWLHDAFGAGVSINPHVAALADPLIHRGSEAMPDVLAWLQGQYQSESGAARGIATGTKKGSNRTSR